MRDRRHLANLLAEWQDRLDRGGDPDPEGFLAAHPEESGALREHLDCLGRLERHAGVVRTEGPRCRFDHHLIEETLRAELADGRREEIHERLAEAYVDREGLAGRDPGGVSGEAAVFLARHGLRGRRPERGLPFLSAALEQLSGSFQSEEAVKLAALALGRPGLLEGEARARVLLAQAHALGVLGKIADQGDAVRELSALAESLGDPRLAGLAAWNLGTWHGNESRGTEAETAFRRAIAYGIGAGDAEPEGQARGSLGHILRHFGRFDEARAEYESARRIARARGATATEGRAEQSLGTLFGMQGRYAEAWACFVRSLDLCHGVGDLEGERSARWFMGLQRVYLGEHAEARAHLGESLRLAQVLGCRHGEASVMLITGLRA